MKTRLIPLDPQSRGTAFVEDAVSLLLGGAVMAYPTETFYGLGAAGFSKKGLTRIYELKKRDRGKALPLIVSDIDMVVSLTEGLPRAFLGLAREFWPGPLTLILEAAKAVPDFLSGPGHSIAVRISPVPWIRNLVRELAQPLTATSANLAGEESLSRPADVVRIFMGKVDVIVDGGPTSGGTPSTIVDLTGERPKIVRAGQIPEEAIRHLLKG